MNTNTTFKEYLSHPTEHINYLFIIDANKACIRKEWLEPDKNEQGLYHGKNLTKEVSIEQARRCWKVLKAKGYRDEAEIEAEIEKIRRDRKRDLEILSRKYVLKQTLVNHKTKGKTYTFLLEKDSDTEMIIAILPYYIQDTCPPIKLHTVSRERARQIYRDCIASDYEKGTLW